MAWIKKIQDLLKNKIIFKRIIKILIIIIIGIILSLCISFSIKTKFFQCDYRPAADIEVKK